MERVGRRVDVPAIYSKMIQVWLFSLMGPSQSISTNLSYITNDPPNKFSKPDLTAKPPQQHGPVKRSGNGRGQQVKSLIVYPSKITIHYRSDNLSVAGAIGSEAWLGQQTRLSPPHATPRHAMSCLKTRAQGVCVKCECSFILGARLPG